MRSLPLDRNVVGDKSGHLNDLFLRELGQCHGDLKHLRWRTCIYVNPRNPSSPTCFVCTGTANWRIFNRSSPRLQKRIEAVRDSMADSLVRSFPRSSDGTARAY